MSEKGASGEKGGRAEEKVAFSHQPLPPTSHLLRVWQSTAVPQSSMIPAEQSASLPVPALPSPLLTHEPGWSPSFPQALPPNSTPSFLSHVFPYPSVASALSTAAPSSRL
jgi:hypothetical protein